MSEDHPPIKDLEGLVETAKLDDLLHVARADEPQLKELGTNRQRVEVRP